MGTFIVGVVIAAIVAGIVAGIVRKKRKGQCVGCGCNCGSCPKSAYRAP